MLVEIYSANIHFCSTSRVSENHVKRIGGIWESSHELAWMATFFDFEI
jgi:hypothetical protein